MYTLTFHQLPVSRHFALKLDKKNNFVHYSERRIIAIDLEMIESLAKTICEHDLFFHFISVSLFCIGLLIHDDRIVCL